MRADTISAAEGMDPGNPKLMKLNELVSYPAYHHQLEV